MDSDARQTGAGDPAATIVVALGGNAISPAGRADSIPHQFQQTRRTAAALADLLATGAPIAITHGNGPQVGSAVRRIELAAHEVYEIPLGICVADLQGGMGYMIAQCINNEMSRRQIDRRASTIVTSVEVDPADPSFTRPTKPIGSFYDAGRARTLQEAGWSMVEVPNRGFRRVVPSPRPRAIIELELIRRLVLAGEVIITLGGGGIPVVRQPGGGVDGREAVIDKDLASSLLARRLDASVLVNVTGESRVCLDYGTPRQRPLDHLTVDEARRHLEAGQFPPGSMGPKIEGAIEFLEASCRAEARAIICDVDSVSIAVAGGAGTVITRGPSRPGTACNTLEPRAFQRDEP